MNTDEARGSLRGAVFGDMVGAPYMIENTYNRYFELGEARRGYSHGKVRTFFPEVTEVSHGAMATARWLTVQRDSPTPEGLQQSLLEEFNRHPRGGWTPNTRLFLTSGDSSTSSTPDWAAVARAVPVALFARDDFFRAMDLTEVCVRATCSNEEAVRMARAVTHCISMGLDGKITPELYTVLEMQYGFNLARPVDDLRAELRGEERVPMEMLGRQIEGAYRYVLPEHPGEPSAALVTEAALRAVVSSDSWEDAVRLAVSYGGPSNAVAGIAGAVAEAVYGEVTPTVVGKLYTHLPIGMDSQLDQYSRASLHVVPEVRTSASDDSVTIIGLGQGRTVYVVPEGRDDISAVLAKTFPNARTICPEEMESFLASFNEKRSDTFAYGLRPEVRKLYMQDGQRLVSPTEYIGPGMPPLRERQRHLEEFMKFKTWCIGKQVEMNTRAGNVDAGQIHYGGAYHMWIGSRRIDFLFGDSNAGTVMLDNRGLLRVELGELRDLSADARFENHHEQSWASRSVFSVEDTIHPLERLQQMREEIAYRLLDEGVGCESHEVDSRHLSEEEREELYSVSNLDRLQRLDAGEDTGCAPSPALGIVRDNGKDTQKSSRVYSIGYGTRSRDGFINTLQMSGIDTVVDIRSIPRSKFAPQFNEDVICGVLKSQGIRYFNGGGKLGDRFHDGSLVDDSGRLDWDKVMSSETYRSGISAICDMASEGHTVAVVSSEGDPLTSHRFGMVARSLEAEGLEVRHIMSNGEVIGQTELEDRLLKKYASWGMVPSVECGLYATQVEEAYRAMNRELGYRPERRKYYGKHH